MKLYRVIDRYTGLFKRDDFIFIEETEIGLDVEASQISKKLKPNKMGGMKCLHK